MSVELDKSGDRVRQMFSQIAPRYDLMNHVLSLNIDRWWRSKTVKALSLCGTETVLDVCTGTGDLALAMAKRVAGRVEVIGTDFCHEMLARARQKQHKSGLTRLRFLEADTQKLPLEDNSCQVVTVAFGLRNVADTDAGLVEMIRVCKPGGQVAVLEFSHPTLPVLKQMYSGYFRYVLPTIGQLLAKNDQSAYHYLPESVRLFPSGKVLAMRMQDCGLRDVKMTKMTLGVVTLYLGVK